MGVCGKSRRNEIRIGGWCDGEIGLNHVRAGVMLLLSVNLKPHTVSQGSHYKMSMVYLSSFSYLAALILACQRNNHSQRLEHWARITGYLCQNMVTMQATSPTLRSPTSCTDSDTEPLFQAPNRPTETSIYKHQVPESTRVRSSISDLACLLQKAPSSYTAPRSLSMYAEGTGDQEGPSRPPLC